MDQHVAENVEDVDNGTLSEIDLSTLGESTSPTQRHEGKIHNQIVENDKVRSKYIRTWSEEYHQRRRQMMQTHGVTESMHKCNTKECYQITVEYNMLVLLKQKINH